MSHTDVTTAPTTLIDVSTKGMFSERWSRVIFFLALVPTVMILRAVKGLNETMTEELFMGSMLLLLVLVVNYGAIRDRDKMLRHRVIWSLQTQMPYGNIVVSKKATRFEADIVVSSNSGLAETQHIYGTLERIDAGNNRTKQVFLATRITG